MGVRTEYAVIDADDRVLAFPSAPCGTFKTRKAATAAAATHPGSRVAEVVTVSTMLDDRPVLFAGVPPWE